MGLCQSSMTPEEKEAARKQKIQDKKIQEANENDRAADQAIKKLLLLGAGESGKSTLFKQMITIYGKGYSEEDRKGYVHIIHNNTITAIKILVKACSDLPDEIDAKVRPENLESSEFIEGIKAEAEVDQTVADHIKKLWEDQGVQNAYNNRAMFQLPDSAEYFFGRLEDSCKADYLPTEQDVLRSRVRTTGIVETEFVIDNNNFKMFDVGGQRNERKKWIHCFENVTAVVFVAAMSEYDQVLYEDETTNRMTEALNLFEEICNSRWFTETSMILFLNKRDLFEKKILEVDLNVCFPEYDGGKDYEAAAEFLTQQFVAKNNSEEKEVYHHVTCATDTENVSHVFNAVKDIIIRQSLKGGGLM